MLYGLDVGKKIGTLSYSSSQVSSTEANFHLSTFSKMSFLLRACSFALLIRLSILVSNSERSAVPTVIGLYSKILNQPNGTQYTVIEVKGQKYT
jgi:hypothetical protein